MAIEIYFLFFVMCVFRFTYCNIVVCCVGRIIILHHNWVIKQKYVGYRRTRLRKVIYGGELLPRIDSMADLTWSSIVVTADRAEDNVE